MIGVSIVLGAGITSTRSLDSLKESWHKYECLELRDNISVSYKYYNGYPINNWRYKDCLIIIEGIIFNFDDAIIQSKLNGIVDKSFDKNEIASFVNSADGDFCIYIINLSRNSLIVFNDILGGLPIFYALEKNTFYVSREYGLISQNLKSKSWNPDNIAEFLTFGYNLKERTFSNSILKLEPASCIFVNYLDVVRCNCETLYVEDFGLKNQYNSKDEAAKDLARLFEESCRRRVAYAQKNGYTIINDLSGGFDSRTILGGIEKCTQDYINLTYEYIQDESPIAKSVLKAVDSKSKYIKLKFDNTPNLHDTRLTYNTDGRINVYTNSVCYNDMYGVHEYFGDKKILEFGGFGGEFIRHPRFSVLVPFSRIGVTYSPTYNITSRICNSTPRKLVNMFKDAFSRCGKRKRESLFKDLYNEYYQNMVRCSGEDRSRMFYFTVMPMMGKDFVMAIRHRLPLGWAGFEFYKEFLKNIDSRLVTVPIFGQEEHFLDNKNLRKIDFKRRVTEKFVAPIRFLVNNFTNHELSREEKALSYNDIENYLEFIDNQKIINKDYLEKHYKYLNKQIKLNLLSIVQFIDTVEKK